MIDAEPEQLLEQPAEDHRVRDVGHLEFVEREQRRLRRDPLGDRRDRIVARIAHEFGRATPVRPRERLRHSWMR